MLKRRPMRLVCPICGGAGLIDVGPPSAFAVSVVAIRCLDCAGKGEITAPVNRAPWILRDNDRRAYLGQFGSFALAIRAMDRIVRTERGMPLVEVSEAEIRRGMDELAARRAWREARA